MGERVCARSGASPQCGRVRSREPRQCGRVRLRAPRQCGRARGAPNVQKSGSEGWATPISKRKLQSRFFRPRTAKSGQCERVRVRALGCASTMWARASACASTMWPRVLIGSKQRGRVSKPLGDFGGVCANWAQTAGPYALIWPKQRGRMRELGPNNGAVCAN